MILFLFWMAIVLAALTISYCLFWIIDEFAARWQNADYDEDNK